MIKKHQYYLRVLNASHFEGHLDMLCVLQGFHLIKFLVSKAIKPYHFRSSNRKWK